MMLEQHAEVFAAAFFLTALTLYWLLAQRAKLREFNDRVEAIMRGHQLEQDLCARANKRLPAPAPLGADLYTEGQSHGI